MLDGLQASVTFKEETARPWVTGTSGLGGASGGVQQLAREARELPGPAPYVTGRGSGRLAFLGAAWRRAESRLSAQPGSGTRAPLAELGSWEVGIVLLLKDKWLAWKRNSPSPLGPRSVFFWHFGIRGNHAVMSGPGGTGKRDAASRPRPAPVHSQPSCASGC